MSDKAAQDRWVAARVRLQRAHQQLDQHRETAGEDIRRLLKRRTEALARPVAEVESENRGDELLIFRIGIHRFGVKSDHVVAALRLHDCTPVPGTPPFVAGVFYHRGQVITMLDLVQFLGLAAQGHQEPAEAILVRRGDRLVGLIADEVVGAEAIGQTREGLGSPVASTSRSSCVWAVTSANALLLDVERLLDHPELTVNHEA